MFCLCVSVCKELVAKVVIFSELQYFSLFFFYNNTQIAILYHISENEQNKDKIGTIPIRARVPLYSKIERRHRPAHNSENIQIIVQNRIRPKRDKNLYTIGIAGTGFRKST